MTREWKTRRITVIISTTNGKKDKIAFAATENANVCTSVRLKYLTVESTIPGCRRIFNRGTDDVFGGGLEVEMGGAGTRKANRSRGDRDSCGGGRERKYKEPVTAYFFIFVKVMPDPAE
jgi:hypothetical protein